MDYQFMIKALFFDLDGTLVDTHNANYEAYKHALSLEGVTISLEDFKKTIGMQAKDFLPILAPSLPKDVYSRIAKNKSAKYKTLGHTTLLNLDLEKFLRQLKPHMKTALVTTAKRENAQAIVTHHNLEGVFDHCIFAEDVANSKPSAEAYLLALKLCGIQPSEAIAFEDSESGKRAAEGAGIPVLMIKEFRI